MYVLHMLRFAIQKGLQVFRYLFKKFDVARIGNPRVLQSHFDAVPSQLEESLESPFLVVLALSLFRHDSNKIEICLMPNSSSAENVWKRLGCQ